MRIEGFGGRGAAAVIGLLLALMASLLSVRVYTVHVSDGLVARREQTLAQNGLRGWVGDVEARVVGQTTWDEAVKHLGVRYEPAWAHKNIGQFLHDVSGFDRAFVLDGANRPLYAMGLGADREPATYAALERAAAPLVARVRDAETRRLMSIPVFAPAAMGTVLRPAVQASAFALVDGVPNIVTVTLVQPDFGKYPLSGAAPLVVTAKIIDAEGLRRFGARFLLSDLAMRPAGGAVPKTRAAVDLVDLTGVHIARLDWTPQTPGRRLLLRTLPVLIIAMVVFSMLAIALFLQWRNAVRALMASESQSKHMAYHDPLTGLPNRAMFAQRMAQALAELRRGGGAVGVLALDLDRFKVINDTYGHSAGDELIRDVALRLRGLARASDTVARLGGDEFIVLVAGASPAGLATFAERIVAALGEPVELPFGRVFCGASVGITLIGDPATEGEEALRQADLAMYRAKDAGRGRFEFYEPEMDLALKARRLLEHDLREALISGGIHMVYQPQIDGDGRTAGVEALARWNHPERGPVSPAFFIPIAEECGLIEPLGEFTLRRAFADSRQWPDLRVAVNVSARQLRTAGFAERVKAILEETGANPHRLELEITEGVLLEDDETTHETLNSLRVLGFSLALDDFGTGYSSLAYLRRYPVDKIKIDRSFITSLGVERESEAVVGAIVKLAKALNLRVIAEGVETETQREGLRRAGCSDIQGFLYSKGLPAAEVAAFAAKTNSGPVRPAGRSSTPRGPSGPPRKRLADLRR